MEVQVSARLIRFPEHCACCGAPPSDKLVVSATRYSGKRVVRSATKAWAFPYCLPCKQHVETWNSAGWGCLLAVIAFFVSAKLGPGALLVSGIVWFAYSQWKQGTAEKMRRPGCVCASAAVSYDGWNGSVHTFQIANASYAGSFMLYNSAKLLAPSQEAQAMIRSAAATLVSRSTPSSPSNPPANLRKHSPLNQAPPALAVNHEAALQKWIEKLEGLKGPQSRKNALASAIVELPESMHMRLLIASSKIEVQAALDKVDGLKTVAARRRVLLAALDEVRSDQVPDALQEEQIRWLETALADLSEE